MSEESPSGGGADVGGVESSPDVGSSPDAADMGQMQHGGALAGYLDDYAAGSFDIGSQEEETLRKSVGGLDDEHLKQLWGRELDVYAETGQDQDDIGQMVRIYAGLAKDVPQGVEPPSSEVVVGWQEGLRGDAFVTNERLGRTEYIVSVVGDVAQERGVSLDGEKGGVNVPQQERDRDAVEEEDRFFALLADPRSDEERRYNTDAQKHNETLQNFHAIETASFEESVQAIAVQYAELEADPQEFFRRVSQRAKPSTPGEEAVQAVEDYGILKPFGDLVEKYAQASPKERNGMLQRMRGALVAAGVSNIVPVDVGGVIFFRREGESIRQIDYAYSSLLMEGKGLAGSQEVVKEGESSGPARENMGSLQDGGDRLLTEEEVLKKSRALDAAASPEEKKLVAAMERHLRDGGEALEVARKVAKDVGMDESSWAFGHLRQEIQEMLHPTQSTEGNMRRLEAQSEVLRGLRESGERFVDMNADQFLRMLDSRTSVVQLLRSFLEQHGERGGANLERMKDALKKKLRAWPLERVEIFLVTLYGMRAAMYLKKLFTGEKGKTSDKDDQSVKEIDMYIDTAKEVIAEKKHEREESSRRS